MAVIDTVYVLGGGEYMMQVFNGVAALIGSDTWDSMFRIVLFISAVSVLMSFMKAHDPKELVKFAAIIILVSSVLLVPKRTVQIIDRTNPTGVYLVDNVPLGLAVPARFITSIGTSLTELYDTIFHTPDSLTYSKTGMLFGANLVGNLSDAMMVDGDLAELMGLYTKNCVIGDILINHKYSFQELMSSRDPYTLIFQKPSPLRGIIVPYGNTAAVGGNGVAQSGFWTCEDIAKHVLMPKLNIDTTTGGKTWNYMVKQVFGGRPDANVLYSNMMGDSYNFYYQGSETASQLMRSSVVMNALKNGISAYSAQSGDTASLVNLASTSSYNKMRLSWATSSQVAVSFVPILNTILLSLVIALFPIFILLAVIHSLSVKMLFNYIMSIIYLQSWPPMFAILNYATSFYLQGKTGGIDFNLANQASIQQMHSDIGLIAGWLSISIPFIAIAIVKGLGPTFAQAGNYLGTAINSSATSTASQAADGTWSFNNMQTGNVAGNKWDTNASFRDGQMTRQLSSGASSTVTSSGQEVMDISGAMSRLAVSIKGSNAAVSSLQQSAKHAEVQAMNAQKMNQHAVNSSWNMLSQFHKQNGDSSTLSKQSDSGEGVNHQSAMDKVWSIAEAYGRANGLTTQASWNELMDKTSRGTVTTGTRGNAGAEIPLIARGEIYGDANVSGSTGSSHGTQESSSESKDNRHDQNAQLQQQFREARDYFDRNSVTTGASQNDNEANSHIQQFAASLNIADTYHEQYALNKTKSQEYSDMASWAENNSAQIDRVFDQQFASFVRQYAPDRADELLGNTSDPMVAKELDGLAKQFVDTNLLPKLKSDYASNHGKIESMDNTESSYRGMSEGDIRYQYDANNEVIQGLADDAGVKHNVKSSVEAKQNQIQGDIESTKEYIDKGQGPIQQKYAELQQEYQDKKQKHEEGLAKEKENQKLLPDHDNLKERVELQPTWPPTVAINNNKEKK
ncbi:conjugal transfer mating-pair stabilization protein TraG [Providencia hangzhouensis]|uniref:conjugal transfer mating-pair stabilization protein TraG n=1 Tax=Providencia hangzhouensis TaxID=3031799 RepID=UPI0034DD3A20